ncbi:MULTISPECIES: PAS domain-containing protein [unclassified Leptolyngbya]|uniref:PAS domain-containing protein n=1 Tax=unclassified Leptolyngbya TaxID=2650499 RepID=UPI0016894186|nr:MULTISPECIES: PAS domain-containing protein [unclassified Leptolyngbya]MBD1909384.1 PAS domain-containing protein [Leptolyngbya sp. FACHB-8]MBD2158661.1 PAS domain-containing protein [Leptolyngbya sp. FACHB-16]
MVKSYQILMVIDESPGSEQYTRQLQWDEAFTYTVLTERQDAQILMACQSQAIDGIFLKCSPPNLSSLQLLGQLKQQMGERCPPIVVIGSGDAEVAVQALKNGATDYLVGERMTPDSLRFSMQSAIENAQLRRELQHSQQQFQTSVENMLDCFGIFSSIRNELGQIVDFRIDYLNKAAWENSRVPREHQIGRGLCELWPGHRESGLLDEYCRVVETGKPLVKDSLIYEGAYGEPQLVRVFDIHASKLNDGFVASWRDVTDRKHLELELSQTIATLQQNQNRLQRLIDTAPIGIGIGSANGEVSVINDAMLALHGYTREEFEQQGMNWRDSIPPEFADRIEPTMVQLRNQGFLPPEQRELQRRDGSRVPIWISATQWTEGTDEHVAFAVDLTQQKQFEATIQQLNQDLVNRVSELQILLDMTPVGIAIATDPACMNMQSNAYIRQLLGINPGDNISKSAPTHEPPYRVFQNGQEVPAEDLPMQVAARLNVDVRDVEFDILLPDGTGRKILAYATPLKGDQNQTRGTIGVFLDVTERDQTITALKASQERYRELAEAMPQMVWTADATGTVNYWNQRWYEYSGLSEAESMGLAGTHAIHPDDRDRTLAIWAQSVQQGKPFEIEYRVRRRDGIYHWFISRGIPTQDNQGQILGWLGTVTDIDNQKRLEERLQLVMRAVNGLIFDWDLHTKNVYRSEQLFELVGVHPEDVPPTADWWQDRLHPEDRARLEPKLPDLYASSHELYEGEYRVWHEEGGWISVWERGCLVRDEQGQVIRVVGSTVDISDRKKAEAALQERSEHIQLLYETTRDLLSSTQPLALVETVFNRLKDLIGLDVYINYVLDEHQQKLHLTFYGGIPQDAVQQLEWLDLGQAICGTVAQQRCQIVQTDVQILTNPKAQLARSLGVTAYASQPLISHGKLFGTLSFGSRSRTHFTPSEKSLFQAICDQIAIAIERSELLTSLQQQTEELMRVNRIKDEFLAVLSHELRSPLNPILGWAKLLQSHTFDAAKTAEALATIERNAKLQTQLIDDLLDIAKILRGKLTLEMAPVNPVFVIEAAIDTVRAAALAKNIHLHSVLPAIGQVSGDAVRLQQIVWNLLSNAIKFTPTHGRVNIQLERVMGHEPSLIGADPLHFSITHYPSPITPYAQITVSDTGKGINRDFLPHIFESFRQEDASTTRKFGGLGLGLAIVRQLVEAHGGTITASSPGEGMGATFTVRLPLVALEPEFSQPKSVLNQEPDLTGIRILIVDDEPDARELLMVLLTQYGAEVIVAASAIEALAMLQPVPPHLLISDIGMPSVDGYALIQQIRQLPPEKGGQIRAIALTAYAGESDQQHAITAGFQQHIAKPIDSDMLIRAIIDWI